MATRVISTTSRPNVWGQIFNGIGRSMESFANASAGQQIASQNQQNSNQMMEMMQKLYGGGGGGMASGGGGQMPSPLLYGQTGLGTTSGGGQFGQYPGNALGGQLPWMR